MDDENDVDIDDEDTLTIVDDSEDLIEDVGDDLDISDDADVISDDNDDKIKSKKFDDDEVEEYGKKVQRRINKEVQKRKVLEDRLEAQEVEHERRMSEFEERFTAREQEQENESINEQLEDVESRRRENREVGDHDQDLEDKWFDLKLKQREAKKKGKPKKRERETPDDANNNTYSGREKAPLPEKQKDWLDSNNWYGKNKARSDYANSEYLQLVSEGYDPEDAELYAELDNRLSGNGESDDTDDSVDTGNDERDERPPPPGRPNRGNAKPRSKAKAFTNMDKQKMREWNLDPNDPVARKAWLSEKRSA